MFGPENENQEAPAGEHELSVVVDLTKPIEEQEKPVTADAGDKAGEKQADGEGADAGNDDTRRDTQAEGDEELDGAPKPWRKRLKREIRQKIEARGEAAALSQRNTQLEEENQRLRTARAEPRDEEPDTTAIDAKLDAAEVKLAKAIEDGESATVAKLQREIATLAAEKTAKQNAPKRVERREEPAPRQQQQQRNGPTVMGRAFMEANAEWWNDPENAAAKAAVITIDNQLIRGGSDANSETHYQRIAKRVKDMGLKVKVRQPYDDGDDMGTDTTIDVEDEPRRQRREPPMGGNGTSRSRPNAELRDARAGRVVLTEADKETMSKFKLDPTNPSHLRAFAKSRQERLLQEAGQ